MSRKAVQSQGFQSENFESERSDGIQRLCGCVVVRVVEEFEYMEM